VGLGRASAVVSAARDAATPARAALSSVLKYSAASDNDWKSQVLGGHSLTKCPRCRCAKARSPGSAKERDSSAAAEASAERGAGL